MKRLMIILVCGVAACSSEDGPQDVGFLTDGTVDAGPTGTLCVEANDPDCTRTEECPEPDRPVNNCDWCPPYNPMLCSRGTCETPPEISNVLNVVFPADSTVSGQMLSYVGVIVAKRTTGGAETSCADGRIDYSTGCYNVLDSRMKSPVVREGDLYVISFNEVPTQRDALVHLYGFGAEMAGGEPIGFSCTEYEIGPRQEEATRIAGDRMVLIQ